MKSIDLVKESSGYSVGGSYTPDLVYSKLWLSQELTKVLSELNIKLIPVAYILGSWYGNLAIILRRENLPIEKIVDVEKNPSWLRLGQQIQQYMGLTGIQPMNANVNKIDYRQLTSPGLVINTSINDIADHGWFDHIPNETIVVLQGRDAVSAEAEYQYNSPKDLLLQYPLKRVLYQGSLELQDPETKYRRSMVIGIK